VSKNCQFCPDGKKALKTSYFVTRSRAENALVSISNLRFFTVYLANAWRLSTFKGKFVHFSLV